MLFIKLIKLNFWFTSGVPPETKFQSEVKIKGPMLVVYWSVKRRKSRPSICFFTIPCLSVPNKVVCAMHNIFGQQLSHVMELERKSKPPSPDPLGLSFLRIQKKWWWFAFKRIIIICYLWILVNSLKCYNEWSALLPPWILAKFFKMLEWMTIASMNFFKRN